MEASAWYACVSLVLALVALVGVVFLEARRRMVRRGRVLFALGLLKGGTLPAVVLDHVEKVFQVSKRAAWSIVNEAVDQWLNKGQ